MYLLSQHRSCAISLILVKLLYVIKKNTLSSFAPGVILFVHFLKTIHVIEIGLKILS